MTGGHGFGLKVAGTRMIAVRWYELRGRAQRGGAQRGRAHLSADRRPLQQLQGLRLDVVLGRGLGAAAGTAAGAARGLPGSTGRTVSVRYLGGNGRRQAPRPPSPYKWRAAADRRSLLELGGGFN